MLIVISEFKYKSLEENIGVKKIYKSIKIGECFCSFGKYPRDGAMYGKLSFALTQHDILSISLKPFKYHFIWLHDSLFNGA